MVGNELLERGTGPRWIGIVLPSQTCQERRELTAGPIASGLAVVRPDFGEDLLFEFQIGIQVNLGSLQQQSYILPINIVHLKLRSITDSIR